MYINDGKAAACKPQCFRVYRCFPERNFRQSCCQPCHPICFGRSIFAVFTYIRTYEPIEGDQSDGNGAFVPSSEVHLRLKNDKVEEVNTQEKVRKIMLIFLNKAQYGLVDQMSFGKTIFDYKMLDDTFVFNVNVYFSCLIFNIKTVLNRLVLSLLHLGGYFSSLSVLL